MSFPRTPYRSGAFVLALIVALGPGDGRAHDASAWGGLFRTRDAGAAWLPLNPGSFVSGALALAVSPVDPLHLLLATDTGVSRSRNGGRDWVIEARNVLIGPTFAAVFDVDGERALVSGASAIFRSEGDSWRPVRSPAGSVPARALVSGSVAGRVYLAGRVGLYRSDDWGQSWVSVGDGIASEHASSIVVRPDRADEIYVVAGGHFWVSSAAGRGWQLRGTGLPPGALEVVALDPSASNGLWAVAAGQVFRSDDQGRRWQPVGGPVREQPVVTRDVAVSGHVMLMATDRGVYRRTVDADRWTLSNDNLPAHLEAGMLVRDPLDPATVYAGFALTSSDELSRRAVTGAGALRRLDLVNLAGGLAFLALLLLAAVAMVRRLARTHYRASRFTPR